MNTIDIEKITTQEQLRTMEALWDARTHAAHEPVSPVWHDEILQARREKIVSSQATFFIFGRTEIQREKMRVRDIQILTEAAQDLDGGRRFYDKSKAASATTSGPACWPTRVTADSWRCSRFRKI